MSDTLRSSGSDGSRPLRIAGAGPAGLSAAIVLARAGRAVEVHEARDRVGHRFIGDFQVLENSSEARDATELLQELGIKINFEFEPANDAVLFDHKLRARPVRSSRPYGYFLRRGPTDGTLDPLVHRVLVLIEPSWHHGVIGIVASRLVERFGVPVFIGTYEDDTQTLIRGSARSIPEFDVFEALHSCGDLLSRFGGHRAAGGFTLAADNLETLRLRLSEFAHQHLKPEHLKPLVSIDVQARFTDITQALYQQMDRLQPCGIGNPEPVFWSANVKVLDQRIVGQSHLKVTLSQDIETQEGGGTAFTAIAWRWAEYFPLPERIDVAYRLRENTWNGQTALELELMGVRPADLSAAATLPQKAEPKAVLSEKAAAVGRSPLLPEVEPKLKCPEPPNVNISAISWHPLKTLEAVMPQLLGNVLIYGYQRPYVSAQSLAGELTYDRPRGQCATVLLWTLPPSWTHLRWLLALAKPNAVYVRNGLPKLPDAGTLRSQLSFEIVKNPDAPLNLLDLGQQWWVAPSTLIAALRDIKYSCPSFGETASLEQELQRLQRWYNCPAERLATLP